MTGKARRALARTSRDFSSLPPESRLPEGLGVGPASNPGGTQGGAPLGGEPGGEGWAEPAAGCSAPLSSSQPACFVEPSTCERSASL